MVSLAKILSIPIGWLEMPSLLTNIVLPLIFNTWAFYSFFNKLRIFGERGIVNILLASILSLLSIQLGEISLIITIPAIMLFGMESWSSRVILLFVLIFLFFFIIPAIPIGA